MTLRHKQITLALLLVGFAFLLVRCSGGYSLGLSLQDAIDAGVAKDPNGPTGTIPIDPGTGDPIVIPTPDPEATPTPEPTPDCDDSLITFTPPSGVDEMVVRMDRGEPGAIQDADIEVDVDGFYRLYFEDPIESGSSQMNESFFVKIYNDAKPQGFPIEQENPTVPNCVDPNVDVFVVADNDNGPAAPPTEPVFIGTFLLLAGEGKNRVEVTHYCWRWVELGQQFCPEFHNPHPRSGCDTTNVNSVHFNPSGLCVNRL